MSLELSRSIWLITSLSLCRGECISRHQVKRGDVPALLNRFAQLQAKARERAGELYPLVVIQEAGRVNGATAAVTGIDAGTRTLTAIDAHGREHTLSLANTGDRHLRHGWVGTVHGSQGATADRSMTHLESFWANTVDARSAYVAISRARQHAAIYTDSKEKLADAIETRTGERQAAIASSRGADLGGSEKPSQSRGMGMG